jgi:hypothetical protein
MADARQAIAQQQAAWLAALQAGGAAPAGTDAAAFVVLAATLQHKRWRQLRASWPQTAAALGGAGDELLQEFARQVPSPPPSGAVADGAAFVAWLCASGRAPRSVQDELLRHRLRRRWRWLAVVWCRGRGLRVGLRCPGTVWVWCLGGRG